jgi:hypothetical protein
MKKLRKSLRPLLNEEEALQKLIDAELDAERKWKIIQL